MISPINNLHLSFQLPEALKGYALANPHNVGKDLCTAFTHNVQRTILGWLEGHESYLTAIPASSNMTRVSFFQPEHVFLTNDPNNMFQVTCFIPNDYDLHVDETWYNTYSYYDKEDANGEPYDPQELIVQRKSVFLKMLYDEIVRKSQDPQLHGFQFQMYGFTILATHVDATNNTSTLQHLLTFQRGELLSDVFTQWSTYREFMDSVDNVKGKYENDAEWRKDVKETYLNGDINRFNLYGF